ncbi:MAG: hypothetical protein L0215_23390 [Gemmataceae bacterium]|nr:hypothetical protein [Gemmataceae bacterium]
MKCVLVWPFALALGALAPTAADAQKTAPVNVKDAELQARQLGGPTLPFQAVRIRIRLQNTGTKQLGPFSSLGGTVYGLKGPRDEKHRKNGPIVVYERFEHRQISVATASENLNAQYPLFLDPKQRTSLAISFGQWVDADYKHVFAFSVPGSYSLKCGWLLDTDKEKHIDELVEVKVQEPEGADKLVYELLKKDAVLAAELLQCNLDRPKDGTYAKVKKLIQDVPMSSYTPYFRFTLARCYLTTKIPEISSARVAEALAADELEKTAELRYDQDAKEFYPDDFPFRPHALAILANLGDRNRANYLFYLHRDHKDSLQWINEFARLLLRRSIPPTLPGPHHLEVLIQKDFPRADFAKGLPSNDEVWRRFRID